MTVPKSHWQGIPDEGSTGARASPQTVDSYENMNNNGEKQEMQVLLDFTLFLVLLLFCVFSRCVQLQSHARL